MSISTRPALAVLAATLLLTPQVLGRADSLLTTRSSFGVYRVDDNTDGLRQLTVGTTVHGTQALADRDEPVALSYYSAQGPLGDVFEDAPAEARVGVVGLGSGAMAAWGRPGDRYHFFEIDPAMVAIAEDPELFTYVEHSEATIEIDAVDGRQGVRRAEGPFDILVLDAFSSDAIPVHLLTNEAVADYLDKLASDGILMFHISNRHFDLEPVTGRVAEEQGLVATHRFGPDPDAAGVPAGVSASHWVVMARSTEVLDRYLADDADWEPTENDGPLWTDDYSNLLGALSL